MSKETIEGNKLIAEFMGAKFIEKDPMFMNGNSSFYYFKETGKSERILHYHFSWDWLMPVVEKIEKYAKVEIGSYQIIIWYKYEQELKSPDGFYCSIPVNTGEAKIDITWKAIIAFITWYSQQNT